jgi:hypothetical protein
VADPVIRSATDQEQRAALRGHEPPSDLDQIRAELAQVRQCTGLIMELLLAVADNRLYRPAWPLQSRDERTEQDRLKERLATLRREVEAKG